MNQHHWQDARLKKALQHAPDREQKPSVQVRERILHSAQQAVKPTAHKSPAKNWKQVLVQFFAPKSRMPWNAAWGTAIVIACVGIVWLFQDPKTAFEPQPLEHFPHQPAPTTTQDEIPTSASIAQSPAPAPAPTSVPESARAEAEKAQRDETRSSQRASVAPIPLLIPSTTTPEQTQPAQPGTPLSRQPAMPPSLGDLSLPAQSLPVESDATASTLAEPSQRSAPTAEKPASTTLTDGACSHQQEAAVIQERPYLEAATPSAPVQAPTPEPAPVASSAAPTLIVAEENPHEIQLQREERDKVTVLNAGSLNSAITSSPPPAKDNYLRLAQVAPSAFEQNITENYDGMLLNSDAGFSSGKSAESIPDAALTADVPTITTDAFAALTTPADFLPEAFATALQKWNHLQLAFEGRYYILYRDASAPLPELLPRMTRTYTVADRLPAKGAMTATLAFYTSDNTALGTLSFQQKGAWQFVSPFDPTASSALTGKLSENQRGQLENILKTLTTR